MRRILLIAVLASFLVSPAAAHLPSQCKPYGKAFADLQAKKHEMMKDLFVRKIDLLIEAMQEDNKKGKDISLSEPDPSALLKLHEEILAFEVDRVLPAHTRWMRCLIDFEDLPDLEGSLVDSLELWHLPNLEDLPPLEDVPQSEFSKRMYDIMLDAAR